MTDELSIASTEADAEEKRVVYRRVLGASLALYVVAALLALLAPATLSGLFGLPMASEWVRAWGGLMLLAAILYLPGFLDPVRARWCNVTGIIGRFALALLYLLLGGGFLWLAFGEAALGVALAFTYFNLFRSVLMSRP